jgi:hypothetical protein
MGKKQEKHKNLNITLKTSSNDLKVHTQPINSISNTSQITKTGKKLILAHLGTKSCPDKKAA